MSALQCRPREFFLKTRNFLRVFVFLSLALVLLMPVHTAADTSTPAAYRQAVQDALALVQGTLPNDANAARQAVTVLKGGTGLTQPEIIADLEGTPPDFEDAQRRLQALLNALNSPPDTVDPAQAQQRLDEVMAMPRYDALHRPPSLFERFTQWLDDRINEILNAWNNQTGSSPLGAYYFWALGTIVLVVVAVLIFRSARGRFTEGAIAARPAGPRAPADYFAEADQFAAAGDRVRAIRALCAGVAATLAGERTWEGSPLTVREIFQRAPEPGNLRPLLIPFEAAVYGGRDIDQATYDRAVEVAARFRQPSELAA